MKNASILSQEEEISIAGAYELFDSHLDMDQAIVFDSEKREKIKENFECRVCMKIPKKIWTCRGEDCSIPFC